MSDMRENREQQSGVSPAGHRLMAADRKEITVTGVREVVSFDSEIVRLVTVCGILNLEGKDLRIHVLNTCDGTVAVTGTLSGVLYEDIPDERSRDSAVNPRKPKGLGRLFG